MKDMPIGLAELDNVMSNYDHEIDKDIAEKLKDEKSFAPYPAWNFYGKVWFESGKYHCKVMRYCSHVETVSGTLEEIMEDLSMKYGGE